MFSAVPYYCFNDDAEGGSYVYHKNCPENLTMDDNNPPEIKKYFEDTSYDP